MCNENKSMKVSGNTIAAEVFGDSFESLGKKWPNVSKKVAKTVLNIEEEFWNLKPMVVLHLYKEAPKQLYQACQKW